MMNQEQGIGKESERDWMKVISGYNKPENLKSWWQIINSIGPYIILWIVMIKTIEIGWWLTLLLAIPAAGFMVRIFIIFHDCGHGSFFKSQKINKIIGIITGMIVFTPYHKWHRDHKIHHQTVGNLEKRGIGDVHTLTVEEYSGLSGFKKFAYRFYRNPFFLFGIAPILLFTLQHRFTKSYMSWREKAYVHLTSLALIAIISGLIYFIGWKTFLMIQLPILYIATVHGVWLFYVQHQYRDVLWENDSTWDYKNSALHGSSWFKLPAVLNWFTGNIGYHHIHHLSPMVPNYNLKKCHFENPIFHTVRPITFFTAFESLLLRLYDVKNKRMIRFSEI